MFNHEVDQAFQVFAFLGAFGGVRCLEVANAASKSFPISEILRGLHLEVDNLWFGCHRYVT